MARNVGLKIPFDQVWERIKSVTKWEKDAELASFLGVQPGTISGAKQRDAFPIQWAFKVSQEWNCSTDWLMMGGDGPMRTDDSGLGQLIVNESSQDEWAMVPQYGDRLSAGGGSFVENGNEVVGHFAFKPKWLKRKCLSGKCAVFHVAGDSMFPIIQDGDVVLVDMGQNDPKEVRDGKIYAFSEGDFIRVKRLSWEGSALWSISDNKAVSPDRPIDMSIFSLIGRVIWVGHEVW